MNYFLAIFLLLSGSAYAQDAPLNPKPFGLWLEEFEQEAHSQGVSQATLDDAFAHSQPLDRVIELDRKQPESVLTLPEYLEKVVTDNRIEKGREALDDNYDLIQEIGRKYGVQPRFIVALWGIETNYGSNIGGFETVDALATLAYDGRRSDYFRTELLNALKIIEQEHISAADIKGSWAGALGQCQFMPGTFLKYAVDYDGDGKRDVWNTPGDVFASIANYLQSLGWNADEGWGRRVKLPKKFDQTLLDIKQEKTLAQWQALGVRKADGSALPSKNWKASVILVGEGDDAVPYLIYHNYKSLLQWNRSRFFATAVGTLADDIGAGE